MIVVASTYMLNIFRKIKIFKLNLGNNFIDIKKGELDIKDRFMIRYFEMTGNQILTYGNIGNLSFYQDFMLANNSFYIFNGDSIFNFIYTDDDMIMKPEDYLTSIIKEIDDRENINKINKDVDSEKNKNNPDIKLPYDQYIEEMIKKRRNSK